MAYDVSQLENYVEQNRLPLLRAAILTGRTIDLINRQSGVKGVAALNIIDVESPLQDKSQCGFNPLGDDKFTQRELETKVIGVDKEWCYKSLLKKWTETQMRNGIVAGDKRLDFEEYITDAIARNISNQMEELAWQGDSNLGIKGLLEQFTDGGGSETALSGATMLDKIMEVYNAIPEEVLEKAVILLGADIFRGAVQNLVDKNLYHFNPEAPKDEFVIPGTTTRVVKVNGLNGTNKIVAADPMNLFYGYDVEDSPEAFDIWYNRDENTIRLRMETNAGFQIAFPQEVVIGDATPSNP